MQEIQNIHPFDPQMISGLEKWILMKCCQIFEKYKDDIDSLSKYATSNFKPLGKRKILFKKYRNHTINLQKMLLL